MSQTFISSGITVTTTGKTQASGAASAGQALPVDSAGNIPRYIRIAATAAACFRLGVGGVPTAVTTDLQVQPGDAVILSTNGATHFAVIQVSAGGVVQVSPLENM